MSSFQDLENLKQQIMMLEAQNKLLLDKADGLAQREQELKILSDSIPQLVWTSFPDGNSDYFNKRWKEYTGIDPYTLSENDRKIFVHPHDLPNVLNHWNSAIKSGEQYEIEYRLKRYDNVYQWFVARAVPIKDENGKVIKWFGTATNIDQQKNDDQKNKFLSEASNLLISSIDYEETLKNIAMMAVPYFADWCTVDMVEGGEINRLAVAHQDPSKVELAKELFKRFKPKLDDPTGLPNVVRTGVSEFVPFLPDSVIQESNMDDESKLIFKNLGLNSYMVVPLRSHDKVVGGISFVKDKTRLYTEKDLIIAEDLSRRASLAIMNAELYSISVKKQILLDEQAIELKRSNEELNNFAYIASHDLQEPLRTITSYSQLLQKRYNENLDSDAHEFFDLIINASSRMKNLIESLLDYSKVGRMESTNSFTDVNQVVEIAKANIKTTIEKNNAVINYANLPSLKIDFTLLVQIFQNLIANSIKYKSEKDPFIQISAEKKEKEWLFIIKDNGIGIEEQYFKKIFIIFQRLHSRDQSGTGIGLATCKKIVENYGGQIWVESKMGEGSTFFFTLPAQG
jgi:PAS domain S-box-containing protein